MRILIVGAGAVGGYFGALLVRAGRDVTFLVRPGRAAVLREHGLTIRGAGRGESRIEPRLVTDVGPGDSYDLVLLTVKAYDLPQAAEDMAHAVGTGTAILPTLNGMRHVDVLRDRFGPAHVIGGVCIVLTQLDPDGAIRQLAPGASLTYGEFGGEATERIRTIDATLRDAGFDARVSATIERDMWEKWVVLAAGGALTTLLRGTVGEIVAVPGGLEAARAATAECAAVAAASGFAPRADALARAEGILTEPGSGFATSMYRDLVQGRNVEADQILGDLVERGRRLGVAVPLLTLAYAGLCVYRRTLGGHP